MRYNCAVKRDYYLEQLVEIKRLMAENQLHEAMHRLNEELSMPYIPPAYQEQFETLKSETQQRIAHNTASLMPNYSDEELLQRMRGSLDEQLHGLDVLSRSNLRLRRSVIQALFQLDVDPIIAKLLIQLCIEQALQDEIEWQTKGIHYRFIPAALTHPNDSVGVHHATHAVQAYFEKEPSAWLLAQERLRYYAVDHLPLTHTEDDAVHLTHQVVYDVHHALGQDDRWRAYCLAHAVNIEALALIN
jgi:hypothetical protein